jgi:Ca-activated chloride channel family protein
MDELFGRLEAPVLKDVSVAWRGAGKVEGWPRKLPDLYLGDPIVIAAALEQAAGSVVVSGRRGGVRWESELALADASRGHGLGGLWARHKIEALLDSLHDGAAEDEVRRAVVEVALAHRLVSKYTSLVAVDRTPARPADEALASTAMATNLPAGWNHEAVFGELPRGATDARWNLLMGSLALLAAATLWGAARTGRTPFQRES